MRSRSRTRPCRLRHHRVNGDRPPSRPSEPLAHPRTHLHLRRARRDRLVLLLEPEYDLVAAGLPVYVLGRPPALYRRSCPLRTARSPLTPPTPSRRPNPIRWRGSRSPRSRRPRRARRRTTRTRSGENPTGGVALSDRLGFLSSVPARWALHARADGNAMASTAASVHNAASWIRHTVVPLGAGLFDSKPQPAAGQAAPYEISTRCTRFTGHLQSA